MSFIYFILIIGLIILVHELGHFFWAKYFGVYVHEFSIGMGPKLLSRKDKKGETEYSLRLIPIGGFVSLAGEDQDEELKKIPKKRALYSKPIWQRFFIMVFGAVNNFILAFVLFFIVGLFAGSTNLDPVITNVTKGLPAEAAGIKAGAYVLEVNSKKTKTVEDVQLQILLTKEKSAIVFKIQEDEEVKTYTIKPVAQKDGKETVYLYGVEFAPEQEKGLDKAAVFSVKKMGATLRQMALVLGNLFTGNLSLKNLSGPVGIYSIVGDVQKSGFGSLLLLTAVLSINIGFINLLPFPAFDGGRIVFLLIEKIRGKAVNPQIENAFNAVGLILLLILTALVMLNDILRIWG